MEDLGANEIRVRFAPSPTGHLHIGGARTAIFNWIFARHYKGKFILRIEDTDRSRSTDESIHEILEAMKWLGLDWDEGPYRQTDRFDIYNQHVKKLLDEGKAYYCYCTSEELEQRRKEALAKKEPLKYDRRCRNLKAPIPDKKPAIRFKAPLDGQIIVHDLIGGPVSFGSDQLDDFIIMRSDGTPTYNFCVVVDDVLMKITHVIRGDDHLSNTPKQIILYNAFSYPLPKFAHVSMILGSDKTRLSKRHGATSVMEYQKMGYLPEALVNYLVRLGWSYKDQEIFTKQELTEKFSIETVNKSAAVFNPEKLLWLNSHYIKTLSPAELIPYLKPILEQEGITLPTNNDEIKKLEKIILAVRERCHTLVEVANWSRPYYSMEIIYEEKAEQKFFNQDGLLILGKIKQRIEEASDLNEGCVEQIFKITMEECGLKMVSVAQPVRVALTGGTVSPGIFEVISLIGKDLTLQRLQKAIDHIKTKFA